MSFLPIRSCITTIAAMESEKTKHETSRDSGTDVQLSDDHDYIQSPISKLPVECLIAIFSLLPIADRVRIQRVCKHWQSISLESWFSLKTLTFYEEVWGYKYWLGRGIDLTVFKKVLKLCGSYVTRIDFSTHYTKPNADFVELLKADKSLFVIIRNYCPNLVAIDIRNLEITCEGLEYLGKSYSTLSEFAIDGYEDVYENGFGSVNFDKPLSFLFRKNKNLQRLKLNIPSNGHCLLKLNPITIEKISVVHGLGGEEIICKALNRFINLRILNINDWSGNHDWFNYGNNDVSYINEMLEAIEPHSEKLIELEISTIDNYLVLIHAENISCFSNLQKLLLDGDALKIDFCTITKYCTQLTYVKLIGLSVSEIQIASIMQLPKLQELYLWYLKKITDAIFTNHMSSLKIFNCFQCSQLTNIGFRSLLQNSSESLQSLTIRYCKKINLKNLIQDAKEVMDTRSTGPLLKVLVKKKGESSFVKKKVTKLSKYLELTEYVRD
ncbi:uncharacterized protein LOC100679445 isoform X1 [Nasonia vitripennis]|uniref:F-box domain-containing protein n=2 Tax=Nasonia vitripennis TaxID=7425 RepID=A0A7M7H7Y2_NASVI|nr:uncharacterized protein LOC100679445 isoform X1 [Nasonia vitripennis]XP_008212747.1 uncharacterized protein LOC100679445 isoform X1 [Nasonia vitripennis]